MTPPKPGRAAGHRLRLVRSIRWAACDRDPVQRVGRLPIGTTTTVPGAGCWEKLLDRAEQRLQSEGLPQEWPRRLRVVRIRLIRGHQSRLTPWPANLATSPRPWCGACTHTSARFGTGQKSWNSVWSNTSTGWVTACGGSAWCSLLALGTTLHCWRTPIRKSPAITEVTAGRKFGRMGLGRVELPTSRLSAALIRLQSPTYCRQTHPRSAEFISTSELDGRATCRRHTT